MMNPSSVIVGLTGQTGAGKSTVSAYFEQNGYAVIDADQISREVVQPGMPCLDALVKAFGEEILQGDGTLNRKKLASIAFPSAEKLQLLNQTSLPYITRRIQEKIENLKAKGQNFILLDAPTLFEAGADAMCDYIVSVVAPTALRLTRIKKRDHLTDEQALTRIAAQNSEEFYRRRSSYVIENTGDLSDLAEQAVGIARVIISAANGTREADDDN